MHLEKLEGLLDQIAQIGGFPLRVINLVTQVGIASLEQVHDRQDLSVVRHQSLANSIRAGDEGLQDLESNGNDLRITGVKRGLDGHNLGTSVLEHVEDTLAREETVRVALLADSLEE